MQKHAFLILAHSDFDLLRIIISCLDDDRNDIYVHIDKKVGILPHLSTKASGLFILQNRIDVRWGDVSVVEAEYALFDAAVSKGPYQYYHLLSGADLPLKSQDYIHQFFDENDGSEFIGYTLTSITPEIIRKVQRWHLFPRDFRNPPFFKRVLRATYIRLQEWMGKKRNQGIDFKKGSQWVSITDGMARYFLEHKKWALDTFHHSFCSDEIVLQTLCWNSPYRNHLFNTDNDAIGCQRAIHWINGAILDWNADDFECLRTSPYLFARKFNSKDKAFIQRIVSLSQ